MPSMDDNVQEIRSQVLQLISSCGEEVPFEEPDIGKIKNSSDDWIIRRFLLEAQEARVKDDVSSAYQSLVQCLKWRKSVGISCINQKVPRELLSTNRIITDHKDKVIYFRSRKLKVIPGWIEAEKLLVIYCLETLDQFCPEGNARMVFDLTGATLDNMDINMPRILLDLYLNYYPGLVSSIWYYNMPWYVRPVVSVMTALIPERHSKKVQRLDCKSVLQHASPQQLPDFMGGQKKLENPVPEDTTNVMQYAHKHGIKNTEQMVNYLNQCKMID